MSRLRFQLDEHLPKAIAQALHRRRIDAVTAHEAGTLRLSDEVVLRHALASDRVLITKDDDFLRLHQQGHPHAGIIYVVQRRRSLGQLIQDLVLIYEVYEAREMIGRIEYL